MESTILEKLVIGNEDNNLAYLVREELEAIPSKLLKFCFDKGFKIYIPSKINDKLFFIKNSLKMRQYYEYPEWIGKSTLNVSNAQFKGRAVVLINEKFIKTGGYCSTVRHEFAHVIDWVLGDGKHYFHEDMPKGEHFDWYRYLGENNQEKFAIALEALCNPERFCESRIHFALNRADLFKKSPNIFKYLEQLFDEWRSKS